MNQLSALSRTAAGRLGLLAATLLLLAFAMRFWLHDAIPYFLDYSEASYRRYWPNRVSLLFHIAGGTIALLAGPFQLWSGLRARYRRLHPWTGYAYVGGIAVSATSSFFLAFHTTPDFGLALFLLAIVWWVTITMAVVAVRNRRIDAHQEWMIRSYIVTFSFASYRALVSLSMFSGLPGRHATVLWISWVVPLLLFELFLQLDRVRPLKRRAAQPARQESAEHAWL